MLQPCRNATRQSLRTIPAPLKRLIATRSSPNACQSPTKPHVIVSGIQPTGVPHIGNYLGALQQWVKLQNSSPPGTKLLFSVVDLHAYTLRQEPEKLRRWKREGLATLLAVGLDPERSVLFFQSSVRAHTELMWLLFSAVSSGSLSRMTQWKAKSEILRQTAGRDGVKSEHDLGLFVYPVLQAADILVHRATHVPVGEDQQQHLELARDIVDSFNNMYGRQFTTPETILSPAKRVMSLREPTLKMSKSHPNPLSRILLTDSPLEIHAKIYSAVTDSINNVTYDPETRPGVSNLLELLSHFDPEGRSATEHAKILAAQNANMKQLKEKVFEAMATGLNPVRERYEQILLEGDGFLDDVAEKGGRKASENAEETMVELRKALALERPAV